MWRVSANGFKWSVIGFHFLKTRDPIRNAKIRLSVCALMHQYIYIQPKIHRIGNRQCTSKLKIVFNSLPSGSNSIYVQHDNDNDCCLRSNICNIASIFFTCSLSLSCFEWLPKSVSFRKVTVPLQLNCIKWIWVRNDWKTANSVHKLCVLCGKLLKTAPIILSPVWPKAYTNSCWVQLRSIR